MIHTYAVELTAMGNLAIIRKCIMVGNTTTENPNVGLTSAFTVSIDACLHPLSAFFS